MKRAVGYLRLSPRPESTELGLEAQEAAIRSWCAAEGIELLGVFADRGVSGDTSLDKRPAFIEALGELRRAKAGIFVAAKRDRWARDPIESAMVERLAEGLGAKVRTADGVANGDTPSDKLHRRMLDAFAEYELALIKARTKAALAAKRARGEKTGGSVPYGYNVVSGKLVKNPREQKTIALIRRLRAQGWSHASIVGTLEARGIPARGARWHATTVQRILTRPGGASRG